MSIICGLLIFVYALFLIIAPIVMAVRLNLEGKALIIILAVLNIFSLGVTGMIAQIVISIGLKKGGYCDYSPENRNANIRKDEKSGYISRLVMYAIEFGLLFAPMVSIDQTASNMTLNQVHPNYNVFEMKELPEDTYLILSIVIIGAVFFGALLNALIRDPRRTFYFDLLTQIAILGAVIALTMAFSDSDGLVTVGIGGAGYVIMSLVMLINIFFSIYCPTGGKNRCPKHQHQQQCLLLQVPIIPRKDEFYEKYQMACRCACSSSADGFCCRMQRTGGTGTALSGNHTQ